jgi:hypothetical protein
LEYDQHHQFESQTLPEVEKKGWLKVIEWTELREQVQKMEGELWALIEDLDDDNSNDEVAEDGRNRRRNGPWLKCMFWKEVMKEIKKKGSRAVAGVQGQFANFEKTQPG